MAIRSTGDGDNESHHTIVESYAKGLHVPTDLLLQVASVYQEREDLNVLQAISGKRADYIGPLRCRHCEQSIRETACDGFASWFELDLEQHFFDEYRERACLRCGTRIDTIQPCAVPLEQTVQSLGFRDRDAELSDVQTFETYQYERVEPCGCRYDPDVGYLADLDRDQLRQDLQGDGLLVSHCKVDADKVRVSPDQIEPRSVVRDQVTAIERPDSLEDAILDACADETLTIRELFDRLEAFPPAEISETVTELRRELLLEMDEDGAYARPQTLSSDR